ncbi:MAG: SHD1 domain-containing protein [Planctomycetota bacterium]|jgi:hypothetical protein
MMRYWILPLALAMIHAGVSEAEVERQSQSTGECSIEADLVELDAGWVTLRTTDGRLIDLPAAKLSRADQRWVRTHSPTRQRPAHGSREARNPSRVPGRRDR